MYSKLAIAISNGRVAMGLLFILSILAAIPSGAQTVIARGGGETFIEGGTGPGPGPYDPFTPVRTTLAFHAEKNGTTITGAFSCMAHAPQAPASIGSSNSASFDVNIMNVVGQITGATVNGSGATLTGTATVTGLGAGTNLPFTVTVQDGGPGATVVLKVNGLTFNEILLDGGHIQVNTK